MRTVVAILVILLLGTLSLSAWLLMINNRAANDVRMSSVIEYYEEYPAKCRDFISPDQDLLIEDRLLTLEIIPKHERSPHSKALGVDEFYDWHQSSAPIPTIVQAKQIEFVFQVYLYPDYSANRPLDAFVSLLDQLEAGACEKEAMALLKTLIRNAQNGFYDPFIRHLCPLALIGDAEAKQELGFHFEEGIGVCH